jgi:uncharacterized protein YifN (PemK superfamily)
MRINNLYIMIDSLQKNIRRWPEKEFLCSVADNRMNRLLQKLQKISEPLPSLLRYSLLCHH